MTVVLDQLVKKLLNNPKPATYHLTESFPSLLESRKPYELSGVVEDNQPYSVKESDYTSKAYNITRIPAASLYDTPAIEPSFIGTTAAFGTEATATYAVGTMPIMAISVSTIGTSTIGTYLSYTTFAAAELENIATNTVTNGTAILPETYTAFTATGSITEITTNPVEQLKMIIAKIDSDAISSDAALLNPDRVEEDAEKENLKKELKRQSKFLTIRYALTAKKKTDRELKLLKGSKRRYSPKTVTSIKDGLQLEATWKTEDDSGLASNTGTDPDTPLETIGKGIGNMFLDAIHDSMGDIISAGLDVLKDVGVDMTFYGDDIMSMMNGGSFSMENLKNGLSATVNAIKLSKLKGEKLLEFAQLPKNTNPAKVLPNGWSYPKNKNDFNKSAIYQKAKSRSYGSNPNVNALLSSGPDLYSNMFDVAFVSNGSNAWKVLLEKDKKIKTDIAYYTPSQKSKMDINNDFELSVRNASISIPTIKIPTFSINFLESSLDIPNSKVERETQATLNIDADYNLHILNFIQHLAGHHLQGKVSEDNNDNTPNGYNTQFAAMSHPSTYDIVVPSMSYNPYHEAYFNPYYENGKYSNIFFRFIDVRILGTGSSIDFSRDSADVMTLSVPFLFKDIEVIYKTDMTTNTNADIMGFDPASQSTKNINKPNIISKQSIQTGATKKIIVPLAKAEIDNKSAPIQTNIDSLKQQLDALDKNIVQMEKDINRAILSGNNHSADLINKQLLSLDQQRSELQNKLSKEYDNLNSIPKTKVIESKIDNISALLEHSPEVLQRASIKSSVEPQESN